MRGDAGFDQFIAFGDSTLDTGYFRYNPTGIPAMDQAVAAAVAAGAKGGFAGPGTMYSTLLAERFGLSAAPLGGGGTNFANGGAHTLTDALGNVATVDQLKHYLASASGTANSRGLYVIGTGNNDLIWVLKQGAAWGAANPDYLGGLAASLAPEVASLQAAGARLIVVPNSFMYAVMAGPGGELPASAAATYKELTSYNSAMWSRLIGAGVNFIPADMDSVFKHVVHHPARFGFTAESVLAANAPSHVSALLTTSAMLSPEQDRTFLFIDGAHMTTAGQQIEADYIYSLLTAPSLVSLVAESAVQSGLSRTASLQSQIEHSVPARGPQTTSAWFSAGASAQRLGNAPGLPRLTANPFGGTVGFDYATAGGTLLGTALSVGGQHQRFSTGGHCNQLDEAVSLYVATRYGHWWGDAVATAGLLQGRIERPVPLGLFTDRNRADTDGHTLAIAVRGGRDFRVGAVTTGPVVGVVLQQVHLDGFTETGTSGVTALAFGGQTRKAAIGQLGWRAAVELGNWRLTADAAWQHDWAGRYREVTAALTTIETAPFVAAATPVSADWAFATLSAAYRLGSRVALHVTGSVVIGNPQVTRYGGNLGLRFRF
ncbi:MAG TPA: autotransporter domain-containing protein [Opitutaceae bacterium]|nr:autotransporter domain-containing protein [Opitutaceae bacterium]